MNEIAQTMIALIVGLVVATVAWMTPTRASCPAGWWVEGIRPSGAYDCLSPVPPCCGDATGPCEKIPCPKLDRIDGRIYCTGGSIPIVVDNATVGCQARH